MINIKVNLLPWREELRVAREENLKKMLTLSTLVGLVGGLAIYYLASAILTNQQERVNKINAEIANYSQAEKLLEERKKMVEDLNSRIKVLTELNNQRVNVVNTMESLAKLSSESVFIAKLGFKTDRLAFVGAATNQDNFVDFVGTIENSKSFGSAPIPETKQIDAKGEKFTAFGITITPSQSNTAAKPHSK